MNTFQFNTYTENFSTGMHGIVEVFGSPLITFNAETFIGNGDVSTEVYTTYGTYNS